MTSEKKDSSEVSLKDIPAKERTIEILSMPGLSVNLRQAGESLEFSASGTLKAA